MGLWSEGALDAAEAGVNRGLNQLSANAQTSIAGHRKYRYRDCAIPTGAVTGPIPPPSRSQFVGTAIEEGYSIAVGNGI